MLEKVKLAAIIPKLIWQLKMIQADFLLISGPVSCSDQRLPSLVQLLIQQLMLSVSAGSSPFSTYYFKVTLPVFILLVEEEPLEMRLTLFIVTTIAGNSVRWPPLGGWEVLSGWLPWK